MVRNLVRAVLGFADRVSDRDRVLSRLPRDGPRRGSRTMLIWAVLACSLARRQLVVDGARTSAFEGLDDLSEDESELHVFDADH